MRQYAGDTAGQGTAATFVGDHGVDPATFSTRRRPSYGVESRETVRALVVAGQDRNGAGRARFGNTFGDRGDPLVMAR